MIDLIIGFIWIAILALVAGFLTGIFDIAGNLIIIPLLWCAFKFAFHFSPHLVMNMTIATSTVLLLFSGASSAVRNYEHDKAEWDFYRHIVPLMAIGAVVGVIFVNILPSVILEKAYAVFLLAFSTYILFFKKEYNEGLPAKELSNNMQLIAGFIVGLLSSFFGASGSIVMVPLFAYLNYSPRLVIGTVVMGSLTIAVVSVTVFVLFANYHDLPIRYSMALIYCPGLLVLVPLAILGSRLGMSLTPQLSPRWSTRLLVFLLVGLSIRLLLWDNMWRLFHFDTISPQGAPLLRDLTYRTYAWLVDISGQVSGWVMQLTHR